MSKKQRGPLAHDVEMCARLHEMTQTTEKALRAAMAPAGKLGLSKHLDARRLAYGVPNGAFDVQPAHDTVYVYQLAPIDHITFTKKGRIVRPDMVQTQATNESPRGLLVAAGLEALDILSSHGIEVGDIVRLLRMSPYRMTVDNIEGHDFPVLVMNAGDIKGSEDTAGRLRRGELRIETVTEKVNGVDTIRHRYVPGKGKKRQRGVPIKAWMPEDY